jgi:GT2 family glycosyltransferase
MSASDDFPAVTVVIPTYNRGHFLERALTSVLTQNYPADRLAVIVIDDGSRDGTRDILQTFQSHYANFQFLQQTNRGPAAARNTGLRAARGEIVAFMDDDCLADANWLRELARAYDRSTVGGVAGRIRYVPPDDNIANRCAARYTGEGQPVNGDGEIAFFVTANASFRRTVLEQVGGFDTAFPHAAQEDLDLSFRAKRAGWQLRYTDTAVVDHYHQHTIRGDLRRYYQIGKAEAILRAKHGLTHSVWTDLPLSVCAFWRVPFGCVRNLVHGARPLESLMTPLLFRLNQTMLALGRTAGYWAQRRQVAIGSDPTQ